MALVIASVKRVFGPERCRCLGWCIGFDLRGLVNVIQHSMAKAGFYSVASGGGIRRTRECLSFFPGVVRLEVGEMT